MIGKKSTLLERGVPRGKEIKQTNKNQEIRVLCYLIRKDKHILKDHVVDRIMSPTQKMSMFYSLEPVHM